MFLQRTLWDLPTSPVMHFVLSLLQKYTVCEETHLDEYLRNPSGSDDTPLQNERLRGGHGRYEDGWESGAELLP